jgi:Icc-related predicted phosphoesterase
MFEAHPYDGKVTGETGVNSKNIKLIEERCLGRQTIRLAFIGDSQRRYDKTVDFVKSINTKNDIDFVIHGGDISDFGVTREFLMQRDILNKLKIPYVVLLGNHDCIGTGKHVYREVFGDENFAFIAGNVKFICLNTNALEYDYSRPVPDFRFIEEHLFSQTPGHEKTVIAMHAPPYCEQFNNNVANVFHRYINEFPDLQFCLNSHAHDINAADIFEDGIIYYNSASTEKGKYLLFTISTENYSYEVVYF